MSMHPSIMDMRKTWKNMYAFTHQDSWGEPGDDVCKCSGQLLKYPRDIVDFNLLSYFLGHLSNLICVVYSQKVNGSNSMYPTDRKLHFIYFYFLKLLLTASATYGVSWVGDQTWTTIAMGTTGAAMPDP